MPRCTRLGAGMIGRRGDSCVFPSRYLDFWTQILNTLQTELNLNMHIRQLLWTRFWFGMWTTGMVSEHLQRTEFS